MQIIFKYERNKEVLQKYYILNNLKKQRITFQKTT